MALLPINFGKVMGVVGADESFNSETVPEDASGVEHDLYIICVCTAVRLHQRARFACARACTCVLECACAYMMLRARVLRRVRCTSHTRGG